MQLAWGYGSDTRHRGENQDCFGVFQFSNFTLGIVCDGMGGHAGGAQASALAVRTIHDVLYENGNRAVADSLGDSIRRANRAIYETGRKSHRLMGMGTTVVAAAVEGDMAHLAHVGDSRIYLVRGGQAEQLTRDHTMVNMFVDHDLLSPEDAASHPEAHVLARSLGVERQVEVEFHEPFRLERGDVIMLCSDGVHGVLTDWELTSVDWKDPRKGAEQVLKLVAEREGADNATVVALSFGTPAELSAEVTDLPAAERIEDHLTPSSQGPIRAPALLTEPQPPALYPMDPEFFADSNDKGTPHVAPDLPPRVEMRRSELSPQPAARPPSQQTTGPSDTQGGGAAAKPRSATSVVLRALAAVALLLVMVMVVVAMFVLAPRGDDELPLEGLGIAAPNDGPAPVSPIQDDGQTEGDLAVAAPPITDEFCTIRIGKMPANMVPKSNLPTPPNGTYSVAITEKLRAGLCTDSLNLLEEAMGTSPDYQKFYSNVWDCFVTRQSGLTHGEYDSVDEIAKVSHAMFAVEPTPWLDADGSPRKPRGGGELMLEAWRAPATRGIQRGLDSWSASANMNAKDDYFSTVTIATRGADMVGYHVANTLLFEASLASCLGRLHDPILPWDSSGSDTTTDLAARYLYFALRHDTGSAGGHARTYQSQLEDLMAELLPGAISIPCQNLGRSDSDTCTIEDAWKKGMIEQAAAKSSAPPSIKRLAQLTGRYPPVIKAWILGSGTLTDNAYYEAYFNRPSRKRSGRGSAPTGDVEAQETEEPVKIQRSSSNKP